MAFQRSIRLFDATMIVAGSMIGSGVFIVAADIARVTVSPLMLLAMWVVTGVLTLIAALSYGELAGMMPKAGGQYVYLRESFGRMSGFLYGWSLFTVVQTGTIAAVAMAFAKHVAVFVPGLSEKNVLFSVGSLNVSPATVVAIASIILLTYINTRGVSLGKMVQNVFTSAKVVAVVGLAAVGIAMGYGSDAFHLNFSQFSSDVFMLHEGGSTGLATILTASMPVFAAAIAASMVGTIFSSDAWNNITFVAGEVHEPSRTVPRALIYGVLLVTGLYLLTNFAYLCVLPLGGVEGGTTVAERGIMYATSDRVGAATMEMLFGPVGAGVMAALIMVSTFGCNNGLILSGARAYYAMAEDKLFFAGATKLNASGAPAKSLWIQCLWASVLCLSGSYGKLLDFVVVVVLVFYVLTIAGIFRLRTTRPLAERPIRAFGYPVLPALYIIAASAICILLVISEKTQENALWGLGIVALGLPVYFLWRPKGERTVP